MCSPQKTARASTVAYVWCLFFTPAAPSSVRNRDTKMNDFANRRGAECFFIKEISKAGQIFAGHIRAS